MVHSKTQKGIIFKMDDLMFNNCMSSYKLTKIANIRYETIIIYMRGEVAKIDICTLYKICKAFNCKIEDIIEIID